MLFKKEKEYLQSLPSEKIQQQYLEETIRVTVTTESLY